MRVPVMPRNTQFTFFFSSTHSSLSQFLIICDLTTLKDLGTEETKSQIFDDYSGIIYPANSRTETITPVA